MIINIDYRSYLFDLFDGQELPILLVNKSFEVFDDLPCRVLQLLVDKCF